MDVSKVVLFDVTDLLVLEVGSAEWTLVLYGGCSSDGSWQVCMFTARACCDWLFF